MLYSYYENVAAGYLGKYGESVHAGTESVQVSCITMVFN